MLSVRSFGKGRQNPVFFWPQLLTIHKSMSQNAPLRVRIRAIFFMFWAVAARRHCSRTLASPRKRAYRCPCNCLASAKLRSNRFLASLINPLAPGAEPVGCDLFKAVLPDMACHNLGVIAALRTGIAQRTAFADPRAAFIFPVSGSVGGAVIEDFPLRTSIAIDPRQIFKVFLAQVSLAMGRTAIADHALNFPVFQTLGDPGGKVTGIQPHCPHIEAEPGALTVQT